MLRRQKRSEEEDIIVTSNTHFIEDWVQLADRDYGGLVIFHISGGPALSFDDVNRGNLGESQTNGVCEKRVVSDNCLEDQPCCETCVSLISADDASVQGFRAV